MLEPLENWRVTLAECGIVLSTGLLMTSAACVGTPIGDEPIYHGYAVVVDKGVPPIVNLRYVYGGAKPREYALIKQPGPLIDFAGTMPVPESFEISWDDESGRHYEFHVPVRSKLPSSPKGGTIWFTVMKDHVEAGLSGRPGSGNRPVRFY